MLPPGTILNTDPAPTNSTITAQVESSRPSKKVDKPVPAGVPVEEEEDRLPRREGSPGYIDVPGVQGDHVRTPVAVEVAEKELTCMLRHSIEEAPFGSGAR